MIRPDEIRTIRTALGLTQAELAERMGLTRDAVAHWETGRGGPNGSSETLLRQFERETKRVGIPQR